MTEDIHRQDFCFYIISEIRDVYSEACAYNAPRQKFDFGEIAYRVFSHIRPDEMPALAAHIFVNLPEYVRREGSTTHLYSCNNLTMNISLPYLVTRTVFQYFLTFHDSARKAESNDDSGQSIGGNLLSKSVKKKRAGNNQRRSRIQTAPPFDVQTAKLILQQVIVFDFPIEAKLMSMIAFVLQFKSRFLEDSGRIFANAIEDGSASFSTMIYAMHDSNIKHFLTNPDAIRKALYSGPLRATTIEAFAARRSPQFRQQCRNILLHAERIANDTELARTFEESKPALRQEFSVTPWSFAKFQENVRIIMAEMRGEHKDRVDTRITPSWGIAAVKKGAKKYYVEKTWRLENIMELIWSVVSQRPHLKNRICNMLEREFHDVPMARQWRRLSPAFRTHFDGLVKPIRPDSQVEEFLNIPPECKSVKFIDSAGDLENLQALLASLGPAIITLDSEWSAYEMNIGSSILQLATRDSVSVIDLDAIPRSTIKVFLDQILLSQRLSKIGFQLNEDLSQIRFAVGPAWSLFRPVNFYCIGKLIAQLTEDTLQLPGGEAIVDEFAPGFMAACVDASNESLDQSGAMSSMSFDTTNIMESSAIELLDAPSQGEADVETDVESDAVLAEQNIDAAEALRTQKVISKREHLLMRRGLSWLCQCMLGRPLDKSEQCSVWTRRPLRPYQFRYAALDAFCLQMLYSRCEQWAARIGTTAEDLCRKQPPLNIPLPLFSGDE